MVPRSPLCVGYDSLLAQRYVDRLDTLGGRTPFVGDSRVDRQGRDITRDVAPVYEEIPAVARDDPAVSLVSIEGPNDSVFQKRKTPP